MDQERGAGHGLYSLPSLLESVFICSRRSLPHPRCWLRWWSHLQFNTTYCKVCSEWPGPLGSVFSARGGSSDWCATVTPPSSPVEQMIELLTAAWQHVDPSASLKNLDQDSSKMSLRVQHARVKTRPLPSTPLPRCALDTPRYSLLSRRRPTSEQADERSVRAPRSRRVPSASPSNPLSSTHDVRPCLRCVWRSAYRVRSHRHSVVHSGVVRRNACTQSGPLPRGRSNKPPFFSPLGTSTQSRPPLSGLAPLRLPSLTAITWFTRKNVFPLLMLGTASTLSPPPKNKISRQTKAALL